MRTVSQARKKIKALRVYEFNIYRSRQLFENAFFKLKHCRGIATLYAKSWSSFLPFIYIVGAVAK